MFRLRRRTRSAAPAGCEETRLLAALGEDGCPICRDLADHDRSYFFWFFNEHYAEPHTLDALTRSLGFCVEHGTELARSTMGSSQLAVVHAALVRRTRLALVESTASRGHRGPARMALGRSDPCPVCRAREASAQRAAFWLPRLIEHAPTAERYGQPGLLCRPHLGLVLPHVGAQTCERLLIVHGAAMRAALESLMELSAHLARLGREGHADLEKALLPSLRLAIGHDRAPGIPLTPEALAAAPGPRDPVGDLLRSAGQMEACPVCLEMRRAWLEWACWLREAATPPDPLDDRLPTCASHVWPIVRAGGTSLALAAARQALRAALGPIESADRVLHPPPVRSPDRGLARLRRAVREPRARRRLAREIMAREVPCPVCWRLAGAADGTLTLLFAVLEDRHHRAVVERGYGLCLRHYARALALDPPAPARAVLRALLAARLAPLEWELEECLRKSGWDARPEATGTEGSAWRRAVLRFSGSWDEPRERRE
jgi:hypothetical protein